MQKIGDPKMRPRVCKGGILKCFSALPRVQQILWGFGEVEICWAGDTLSGRVVGTQKYKKNESSVYILFSLAHSKKMICDFLEPP